MVTGSSFRWRSQLVTTGRYATLRSGFGGRCTTPAYEDVSPRAEWVWYVVAAVSYIAAGSTHKALLTWLIGPAWVVITLWFGPIAVDAVAATLGVRYRRPR